jgi:hypothetical protein
MNSQDLIKKAVKPVLFVFLLAFVNNFSFSQVLVKSYDYPPFGSRNETGASIEYNLILNQWSIAGFSDGLPGAGMTDWSFLRIDNSGNLLNSTLLGIPLNDTCYSHVQITQTPATYMLAGFMKNVTNNLNKATITVIDSNGNVIMAKRLVDTNRHTYREVILNQINQQCVLTGFLENIIQNPVNPQSFMIAASYLPNGIAVWIRQYVSPNPIADFEAYSICFNQTNQTYAITGRTNLFKTNPAIYDVYVTNIDLMGNVLWTRIYKFAESYANSNSRKIICLNDGSYAIIGWSNTNDAAANDVWVLRITPAGIVISSRLYGNANITEKGYSIVQTLDNSLALTGYTTINTTEDELLVKLAGFVNLQFVRIWDKFSAGNDRGYDIKLSTVPPGYAITGKAKPVQSNNFDTYLMKTDLNGNVTPGCVDSISLLSVMKNPVPDSIYFFGETLADVYFMPLVNHPGPVIRNICILTNTGENKSTVPVQYALIQNYPNPFNSSTNIEFSIPVDNYVNLSLYDLTGKRFSVIIDEFKFRGKYIVSFDASEFASGIYYYKLQSGNFSAVRKMILIK